MMITRTQRRCAWLLLAAMSAAGCVTRSEQSNAASDGLPGTPDCVFILYIQNFDIIDTATLIVYAPNPKDAFLVKLSQPVPDLNSRESIKFEAGHHDGRLCGVDGDTLVRTPPPQRVAVAAVRALRAADVKQLKAAAKGGLATPPAAAPAEPAPAQH
jgi:hypothetical protein